MRIILSRKGFDSTSGGCPSPIFPDGSMLALPIPDATSPVSYADLRWRGRDVGELVRRLTRGAQQRRSGAHLDPDLRADALRRTAGWRPALGQLGAAQGHLRNRAVRPGDLFLFWGLYRDVDDDLRWLGRARHVIWGWLQVGTVAGVDDTVRPGLRAASWRWARSHPHLAYPRDPSNTLYVAADRLTVPGARAPAAGVFERFDPSRQLTAPDARTPSSWLLPAFMRPKGRPALSYHDDPARWTRRGSHVGLLAASRGQEFVLDAALYDGAPRVDRGPPCGAASEAVTPSARRATLRRVGALLDFRAEFDYTLAFPPVSGMESSNCAASSRANTERKENTSTWLRAP